MEYTVLIIDGDRETHTLLADYLTLSGFRVYAAGDGFEGIRMLQVLKPDVVLIEPQLSAVDGFQVLRRMRNSSVLNRIPVVFISRSHRTSLKVKALENGADDFICKPLNRIEVLARIRVVLRCTLKVQTALEIMGTSRQAEDADETPVRQGVLKGHLKDVGLGNLLQAFETGKKTARLSFPEMLGSIDMRAGRVVGAEQGAFKNEEAMIRLLFLEKGSFTVRFDPEALSAEAADAETCCPLLDSFVNLDTLYEVLSVLPEKDPMIDDVVQLPAVAGRDLLEGCLPLPLSELLVLMPGNLVINADLFVQQLGASREASLSIVRWR